MGPDSKEILRYPPRFVARRAFFRLFGHAFRIFGTDGALLFYVRQKAFRLREEVTVFADEAQTLPQLRIRARQILDFSATYDITDANSGEVVGALRRKGLRSLLRDAWVVLSPGDDEVASVEEDSAILALLRRFLFSLIPQGFHITIDGRPAGVIHQRWNPFLLTYDVDLSAAGSALDPRLGVALAVMLLAIEGRQEKVRT